MENNLVEKKTLTGLLSTDAIRKRFEDMLGERAPGFISSIISSVNSNPHLKDADPQTVIGSAAVAAALDLPITTGMGFAHIVPYSGRAQFQMGWKGFVQLALRTGQYQTMSASEVYEDELESWNPMTGEFKTKPIETWKMRYSTGKIVGFVAYIKLVSGFEKYHFMTMDEMMRHGKRYSKSFGSGRWSQDFNSMALKTVLKLLLSKFGLLSIQLQKAVQADQAIITTKDDGEDVFTYIDNPGNKEPVKMPEKIDKLKRPNMSSISDKEIENDAQEQA